jgi:hypothetical protein
MMAGKIGFVYYHAQDAERIRSGKGTHLGWGPPEGQEDRALEVGALACRILSDIGLVVEWDGSFAQRIYVRLQNEAELATEAEVRLYERFARGGVL